MRRILVIFLILLFPLNVFALSMSASTAQQGGAQEHVMAALSLDAAQDAESRGDVDPDEPPSVPDLHDLVNQECLSHLAGPCAGAAARHDPARRGHAFPPPVKPPRLA
ncbi:hypothetical protein [Massilia sp. 9I]|uniref:hypothetical protein n=1 Tax=Massilia sp. 9I TaxID=2653152 RepID=UPI0012F34A71|nr:hypothetical protein [Massilia sp. 9I]VXB45461.1 conserved exported hypothetical protein [Massilia sp. 9I]